MALLDGNAILPSVCIYARGAYGLSDLACSGTLFDPIKCVPSTAEAQLITTLLLQPFENLPPRQRVIGEHLGWSFTGIEANVIKARDILVDIERAEMSSSTKEKKQNLKTGIPSRGAGGTDALAARIMTAQADFGVVDVSRKWLTFGPRWEVFNAARRLGSHLIFVIELPKCLPPIGTTPHPLR